MALGGNFYEMQPSIGRFDASYGSILRGDGKGNFTPLLPSKTGFILRGAVRDIKKVGKYIVVSANNAPLQEYLERWIDYASKANHDVSKEHLSRRLVRRLKDRASTRRPDSASTRAAAAGLRTERQHRRHRRGDGRRATNRPSRPSLSRRDTRLVAGWAYLHPE